MIKKIYGHFDEKFKHGGHLPQQDIKVKIFDWCGFYEYAIHRDGTYYVDPMYVSKFIDYCNLLHFNIIIDENDLIEKTIEVQEAIDKLKEIIDKLE